MDEQPQDIKSETLDRIIIGGDLAALRPAERAEYYTAVCHSLGLNPLTKPFEYLNLNGKLRLYALRDCADQLRRLHGISIYIVNRERLSDIYIVTARAKDKTGREDESTGAVTVGNLKGDALANALMKCETKAKRRVTLSIAGLGWLDESEIETIPQQARGQNPSVSHPEEASQDPADSKPTADQVNSLVETARSAGVDLITFGRNIRGLMQLPEETKITKKLMRESMNMEQFEAAWQHYSKLLQKAVEEDVDDHQPPRETTVEGEATTEPEASDSTYATPQQIEALKLLAKQVGDDARADVMDMIDHHPEGIVLSVYEIVNQRLMARKAAKQAQGA